MKLNLMSALLLSAAIFSSNIAFANHHEAGEADANKEQYKSSADANKDGTLDEAELKTIHEMGNKCDHHNMNKQPAANKT